MTDEIRPALTPEEWKTPWGGLHNARGVDQSFSLHLLAGKGGSWLSIKLDDRVWNLREPDSFFVVMALANAALPDGDPRKITRKEVVTLRAVARYARESVGYIDPDRSALLLGLAAKLAALLPPDVTSLRDRASS